MAPEADSSKARTIAAIEVSQGDGVQWEERSPGELAAGRRGQLPTPVATGLLAFAQAMMFELPLTKVPSGSYITGSFSWPLIAFSSGLRPVVNRPKGMPLA
jgi:hypothetical protein